MPFEKNLMKKNYRKLAILSLILVYLVIAAGAIVRMTGSGMGCPDWPKCFGYYIPPTEKEQLEWQPFKEYKKGQVIILDEVLWVAVADFSSGESLQMSHWTKYTRHDYAEFNAFHTWTEFINRLLGALAGLAVFIMALASLNYWKSRRKITVLSWVLVFAMGFQAWLGATVVYSVLEPVKITLHMVMALIIVAILLYLIFIADDKTKLSRHHKTVSRLIGIALLLTLVQVIMGTQVREYIDMQVAHLGYEAKDLWLSEPTQTFYVHRSFSIIVVLVNAWLALLIYRNRLDLSKINWVILLLLAEVATGMAMYYLDFPFSTQPWHLLLASLLFGVQFYLLLESRPRSKTS